MSSRAARYASTSARLIVGAAIGVAAVVGVVLGVAAPWPTYDAEPVSVTATPAPSDLVLACDGPLLALGRVVEQAGDVTIAAEQSIVAGPSDVADLRSTLSAAGGATPAAFTAPPVDGARASIAAAGSASVDSPDLRGFAASACRPPLLESWLVAGATTLGSSDLVLLANPGRVAATVQLTVFGAGGAIDAPGGSDRVVPAGAQVVVPLAGLLPEEESPIVRVTSAGAPVAASLQSSLIRTLEPGGVDQVAPTATAAQRQVVPGVAVSSPPGEVGASSAATLVRILSPGADATARVTVLAADGTTASVTESVPLSADVPTEVELASLAVGRYTVVVEATAPVVAGAWSTSGVGAGSDFAWYAAAPQISTPSVLAVPAGPSPVLTVASTRAAPASVSITDPAGTETVLTVPVDGAAELPLAPGTVYTFDPSEPVVAAVSYSGDGALAGFALWGADAAAQPLLVYP